MNNPQPGAPLSPREWQVLKLVAADVGFKTIADQLGVTTKTVEKHVQRAYRKLEIHSVIAATHYVLHRGAIPNRFAEGGR